MANSRPLTRAEIIRAVMFWVKWAGDTKEWTAGETIAARLHLPIGRVLDLTKESLGDGVDN